MRVLFCHDGPVRIDELGNHYGTAHNDDTFIRYYDIADSLAVAMRVARISSREANKGLSRITVSPFEVVECPNIASLKGQLINKKIAKDILDDEVQRSDYIIARLPSFIGFIAVDMAKKHNKPYLVEVVSCPWDVLWNYNLKGKLLAPAMYASTKKGYGKLLLLYMLLMCFYSLVIRLAVDQLVVQMYH